MTHATITENKKARFDYEILEVLEVGIVLLGEEVKSVRAWNVNLKGSYVSLNNNSAVLIGAHIAQYPFGVRDFDPRRERRLLLKERERVALASKSREMGATCVLLSVFTKWSLIKGELALVRGRKKWLKKQLLKERDLDRETSTMIRV